MIDSISGVVAEFSAAVWIISSFGRLRAGGFEGGGTFSTADFALTNSRVDRVLDFFADFDPLAGLDDFCGGEGRFVGLELFGIRAA